MRATRRAAPHRTAPARRGAARRGAARRSAAPHRPVRCCVVRDLDMPGMNGIEVQSALSGRGNPPVVFLSGAASDADRERALRAGASSFIAKPASGDCLLDAVEEALAGVAAG